MDPAFVHLADQLRQAVLVVSAGKGTIEHANHAAVALTGYSRAELARLTLSDLLPGEGSHPLGAMAGHESGLPSTLYNLPLNARGSRRAAVDLYVSRMGAGFDATLLILAEDAAPRLRGTQAADTLRQSLNSLQELVVLCVSPEEGALERALTLVHGYMGAAGAGLYLARPDRPGMFLAASAYLGPAFPNRLPPNEMEHLLKPAAWTSSHRARNALTQAARFSGWGTLYTSPVGETPGHLGLLFAGYRPDAAAPELSQLGVASQLVYLILRQQAQQEAMGDAVIRSGALINQLEAVLSHIREGVLLLSSEGKVVSLNSGACELLGYHEGEATGAPFEDLLVTSQGLATVIHSALAFGGPPSVSQVTLHNRLGEQISAAVHVVPMTGRKLEGDSGEALVIIEDQRERLAYERSSQEQKQRSLLGQVSAILAHQVRNPVNNIGAVTEYLALRAEQDASLEDSVGKIREETQRLNRLIEDVLKLFRPLELNFTSQSLAEALDRVLERWAPRLASAKVSVRRDYAPAPPVMLDTTSIEEALTNLVDNAIQAMDEGGTLSVMIRPIEGGPRGRLVELRVADSGHGMDEATRVRIFDPYFTTRGSGNGLGLAITEHIIANLHKGSILVETFQGAGSIFVITLPAATEDAGHAPVPPLTAEAGAGGDERTVQVAGQPLAGNLPA